MKFWLVLVALTVASLVGTNLYAAKHEGSKSAKHKMTAAEVFNKMDTNHDGQVTLNEFKAYHKKLDPKKAEEMFSKMAGGKTVLTLDQFKKVWAEHEKAHREKGGEHHAMHWGSY